MSYIENDKKFFSVINNINCVSDYVAGIDYIRKYYKANSERLPHFSLFFRGSSNFNWDNIPSIMRNPLFIKNELSGYNEMLSRCSQDFKHCRTTFDHLVMLQHYSYPTRLLDITTNPLVALYFACSCQSNSKKTAGKVNVFAIQKYNIFSYDHVNVATLANLTNLDSINILDLKVIKMIKLLNDSRIDQFYQHLIAGFNLQALPQKYAEDLSKIVSIMPYSVHEFWGVMKSYLLDSYSFIYSVINATVPDSFPNSFKKGIENQIKEYYVLLNEWKVIYSTVCCLLEDLNSFLTNKISIESIRLKENQIFKYFFEKDPLVRATLLNSEGSLLHYFNHIKKEHPNFDADTFSLNKLESVICVKPKLDNPHIIKQSGAFFLFGLSKDSKSKIEISQIPDNYNVYINNKEVVFKIKDKSRILDELKVYSITEGNLFTDINKVAQDEHANVFIVLI